MPLSPKQVDFLQTSTHSYNISSGVASSGKTWIHNLRFYEYLQNEAPAGSLLLLTGKTKESLYDNVVRGLEAIDDIGCIRVHGQPLRVQVTNKNIEIACIGADDESSWGRLQGKTVWGWYADEITLHPESLVGIAVKSCRAEGKTWPKFWTCNPDHPDHYIKRQYIDNTQIDVKNWYWGFEDNPVLSKDYISELKNTLSGIWLERLFHGRWVAAQGGIYDKFNRSIHVIRQVPVELVEYVIGIDWGYENPLALVLIGIDYDGTYYILDEIYKSKQLIDKSLVDLMAVKGWFDLKYNSRKIGISYAYADSARPDYVYIFNEITKIPTIGGRKEVNEGIQSVQRRFIDKDNGKYGLYILEQCHNTIKEIEGYHWHIVKGTGKDEPEKKDDHICDALRYVILTRDTMMKPLAKNPFR